MLRKVFTAAPGARLRCCPKAEPGTRLSGAYVLYVISGRAASASANSAAMASAVVMLPLLGSETSAVAV